MTAGPAAPSAAHAAAPGPGGRPRLAGGFLAGAQGRLLPASVPMRFFGAALVFHLLAWLALAWAALQGQPLRGGPGWPLAALHLATLGTLLCSAIGASLQLLPVATRRPVQAQAAAAALWWVYVPGVAVLALGMGLARPPWMAAGGTLVLAALGVYALLLALNLRGARGMPGVVLHGWGALAALALLMASAAALLLLWLGRPLIDRDTARALHLLAGVFGVMGLLVLGLSYILIPMFALALVPNERLQRGSGAAALAALVLAAVAALPAAGAAAGPLRLAALACGGLAVALHLHLMRSALAGGLRRELGRLLRLARVAWGALALALVLALLHIALAGSAADPDVGDTLGRLFVIAAVAGWLLSFLFGVLQRVLPFLASLHAARGRKRPPTPSALAHDAPLAWHFVAHVLALALLVLAAAFDSLWLQGLAAAAGSVGAAAFVLFFATLLHRMRQAVAAPAPAP
ncbi:MAG: hypothetical protein KF683_03665 [Rubrivivax sp.]|nr:hypothetical protein [Rubrivivax sp.]